MHYDRNISFNSFFMCLFIRISNLNANECGLSVLTWLLCMMLLYTSDNVDIRVLFDVSEKYYYWRNCLNAVSNRYNLTWAIYLQPNSKGEKQEHNGHTALLLKKFYRTKSIVQYPPFWSWDDCLKNLLWHVTAYL